MPQIPGLLAGTWVDVDVDAGTSVGLGLFVGSIGVAVGTGFVAAAGG